MFLSIVQFGDSVVFSLRISRTDVTFPVYAITLTAAMYHPLDEVMKASFDRELIASTIHQRNETRTTLNLAQLDYRSEQNSVLQTNFIGFIGSLVFTVRYIEIRGIIEYQSDPSNGHVYHQSITFPRVYFRHAEFSLELNSTSLEMTEGNLLVVGERATYRASVTNIFNFGPPGDLVVVMEANGTYLNITTTDVVHTM